MKFKNIPFDEVYDIFAIRIILDDSINEKADCWRIYSIVTDFYKPNQERLRDWLSIPKVNGYESLHTTVMGHRKMGWKFKYGQEEWTILLKKVMQPTGNTKLMNLLIPTWMNGLKKQVNF